ncbi:MAG: glycosyltransferase family 2 protein [Bacteroidaceae bacterium]|nr:glycosyltransferase family 2 protein [Bacteroidaceae bacterium]
MPEVSVLVAVYNAASTLPRCLDSLLNQTLHDIQIICIDDASTDTSSQILRQYQEKHSNIDIITLSENHGQAYARNQGIPLIKAPFTAFLDSDDYLASDALQLVIEVFQKHPATDCVQFDVRYIYSDGHEHGYRQPQPLFITGHEAFVKALTWDMHGWYVARTELYQQYPYDDTCHSYSDDNTTMAHFLHSREVRWCNGRYYFVQNDNSCTHQATTRRFDWLMANESLHNNLVQWGIENDTINLYEEQRWNVLLDCFWFYHRKKKYFTKAQLTDALQKLHHAWSNIDTRHLPNKVRFKPGYMPLHPFWILFKWQEWALYMFRKLKYDENGKKKF